MISRPVARRYARAIFELADEAGAVEETGARLRTVLELIGAHEELEAVFNNPAVSPLKKKAIFDELEPRLELGRLAAGAIRLLIRKGRIHYLEAIARQYEAAERERRGVVVARVVSARPLDASRSEGLRRRLAEASGKEVELSAREDPELIGGLVVSLGGTVHDGSVKRQLELIERRLREE